MQQERNRMSHRWILTLYLAVAYFAAGYLGLQLPAYGTTITLIWLPSGIAVGFLFRWGYGCWPGVALGAFAVNLAIGVTVAQALGTSAGNTLGPLLATAILRRIGFDPTFEHPRDILFLGVAGTIGMLVSASVGVASLAWVGRHLDGAAQAWLIWWAGDSMGVISAAPLVLVASGSQLRVLVRRWAELTIWVVLLGLTTVGVFVWNDHDAGGQPLALAFLPLPYVVWAAMRFGATGTSLALILLSFGSAYGTATGHGPFFRDVPTESVAILWTFMATSATVGWLVNALMAAQLQAIQVQRLLERALGEASLGVLLTDSFGHINYANSGFTSLTGYTEAELLGKNCRLLQGPETDRGTVRQIRAALIRHGCFEGEILNYRKDGSSFWNALLISPIHDEWGKITGFLGIQRNVTLRRRTESALSQSEDRLRTIVNLEPECVKILSPDGRLLEMNPAGLAMIETDSIEHVRGKSLAELVTPEDRAGFIAALQRVANQGEEARFKFAITGFKGTRRWLESHAVPFRNERGEITGMLAVTRDVTQQKLAAEELERTLNTLRVFINSVPALIAFMDADERYRLVNQSFEKYFDLPADRIIGRRVCDLHPPNAYAQIAPQIQEVLRGNPVHYQSEIVRPDGTTFWFDAQYLPRHESDGTISGYFVMVFDITESKRTTLALEESRRRIDGIVNSIDDVVYSSTPDGAALLFVSDRIQDLYGRPSAEFMADPMLWLSFVHPDDRERIKLAIGALATTGTLVEEYRIIRADGSIRWVRDRGRLVKNDDGHPIHFDGIVSDITASKEAEAAIEQQHRVLSTLLKNLPGMVYRCMNDRESTMTFVSDGSIRVTGYEPAELEDNRVTAYGNLVHPDDASWLWTKRQQSLKARTPCVNVYRIRHKSGEIRWVTERVAGIYGADGSLQSIEGFVQDVTESRRADEQIRTSLREKEALLKEIHHRVKNNLQIVTSLLNLQADATGDPGILGMLRESQNRVRSMALVHEALYQSGNLGRIDLVQYVDAVCSHLFRSYGIATTNVQLVVDVANVSLDLDRAIPFGLIINELISNALKYAFPDDRTGRLSVKLYQSADRCFALTVSDDGIGLPESIDMQRLKSLGLQIVRDLVGQLGGSLALHRSPGTEFQITFPREASGSERLS